MNARPSIGFIGAGRVATALAVALADAGYSVPAVASRTRASAKRLATRTGPGTRATDPNEVATACDVVFITTVDDAIGRVAAETRWRPGVLAVHCSGALSASVLDPVVRAGGHAAGFHPLHSFAVERPGAFRGVTVGLEANEPALRVLEAIAQDLGAHTIVIPSGGKGLYHAAAVLVSNYVVTLAATGTDLLTRLGVPREDALRALLGLMGGALQNLKDAGLPNALTGPIARGDAGTVRRHLEATAADPALTSAYAALGLLTVPVALAKGALSEEGAQELARVLSAALRRSASDVSTLTEVTLAQ